MSLTNANNVKPPYMLEAELLRTNPGQWEAYNSTGSSVILAGPGSGKTKTLTIKLARMLSEDVKSPRGIACITYNTQCARELKKRLSLLGVENSRRVSIGTLHSFCLKHILSPYAQLANLKIKSPIAVASNHDIERLHQKALEDFPMFRGFWSLDIDRFRRIHLDRSVSDWDSDDNPTVGVIEKYESLLYASGLVDFDAMVLLGLQLIKENEWVRRALAARFPILVVDEYQDLGYALHQIVLHLCFDAGIRLVAVGDPDQSIYGFTGAQPRLLRELASRDDVAKITLQLNYRCGQKIISASEAALDEDRGYQSGRNEQGEIFFHEKSDGLEDQATFICEELIPDILEKKANRQLGDIAVLYIDRNDGDVIAKEVSGTGWKYMRVDGNNPYQASPVTYWLEDCSAWCAGAWKTGDVRLSELISRWLTFNERLVSEKERRVARVELVRFLMNHRYPGMSLYDWLSQIMASMLETPLAQEPKLRDDKVKVENLLFQSSQEGALKDFTVAYFGGQGGAPDHLRLSTLHSAKGLEYDVVILFGIEEGRIPWSSDSGATIREKRRLFYVGLTRARFEVHLLYSGWYHARNGRTYRDGRSRFVDEVERKLMT